MSDFAKNVFKQFLVFNVTMWKEKFLDRNSLAEKASEKDRN